jgi:hypothetical protein
MGGGGSLLDTLQPLDALQGSARASVCGGYFVTRPVSKNSAYCFSAQLHSQNCVRCERYVLGTMEHRQAYMQQGLAQADIFSICRTLRPQDSLSW